MTRGQIHTPTHLSNSLLFSTQKNRAEWETTMEGQPFCSGGELLPTHLFLKLFLQHGLKFSAFKAARVRYWKAPMKVGIRQPYNTNVTQHGKYWWLMNMWVPLEGTWPLRWMKVHILISLSFTLPSRREKELSEEMRREILNSAFLTGENHTKYFWVCPPIWNCLFSLLISISVASSHSECCI